MKPILFFEFISVIAAVSPISFLDQVEQVNRILRTKTGWSQIERFVHGPKTEPDQDQQNLEIYDGTGPEAEKF